MYSSLLECSPLPATKPRTSPAHTFFDESEDFVEFFSGRAGMHELLLHEDKSNVEITLQPRGIAISHSSDVIVKPIEMSLRESFYDVEFNRCLQLSVLNCRCSASQTLILNRAQYALLYEAKFAIIRDVGLTEVFMGEKGLACLYGSMESVLGAYLKIKKIFNIHGLGDPEIMTSSASSFYRDFDNDGLLDIMSRSVPSRIKFAEENWSLGTPRQHPLLCDRDLDGLVTSNSQSSTSGRGGSVNQSSSFNSMANEPFCSPSMPDSSPQPSAERIPQRASIKFLVRMSDASRLIGTRGATKRRIEHVTGCTILLRTDKKENNHFPIEVFSTSAEQCEIARQHILGFLAGASTSSEYAANSTSVNVRPKIHLDISPKKVPKQHSD